MVVEPTYQTAANDAGTPPPTVEGIWALLHEVNDPEVPVISVVDLGIVRDVRIEGGVVTIDVTPTYSGCPATKIIEMMIKAAVESKGYDTRINTVITPPWTTAWISPEGREKLRAYGIAPPEEGAEAKASLLGIDPVLTCPQCGSNNSERTSEFGSTACKALYKCRDCLEPFEYFKCI